MVRRVMISLAVLGGLLAVAALGVIAFRTALAEAVLSSQLASLGVPARLTVDSLDFHRMVLSDISLGRGGELQVDTARLSYRPGTLLAGRIEEATVEGLRLRLDLTGEGPPLGSLQPLVARGGGAPGAGVIPAVVFLSGGQVRARTPDGEITAALSAHLEPLGGVAILTLSDIALPHVALESSLVQVHATPDRIAASAKALGAQDALELDLQATVESVDLEPTLAVAVEGSVTPGAWTVWPWPRTRGGRMALSSRVDGRLQPVRQMPFDAAALTWLLGGDLRGRLRAVLEDVDYRDWAEGISGEVDLALAASGGSLGIDVAEEGRIRIARIDPALAEAVGVSPVIPPSGDAAVTVTLPARDAPLRLRLQPTGDGADLALSGAVRAASGETALEVRTDGTLSLDEGYGVRRVSFPQASIRLREVVVAGHRLARLDFAGGVDGPPGDLDGTGSLAAELGATHFGTLAVGGATTDVVADFRWTGQRLAVDQRGDGSATVASLDLDGTARSPGPFAVRLNDGELTLEVSPDGPAVSHAVTIRPEPVAISLPRLDGEPIAVRVAAGTIRLTGDWRPDAGYRGTLDLADGSFELPEQAVAAEAVAASIAVPPDPEQPLAEFTVARLVHKAEPAYVAPLRVDGEIALRDDELSLEAAGTGADGEFRFSIHGNHRIAGASGTLRVDVPAIAFRKGGLQPGQLSPQLGNLRDATGRIAAVAEFTWGPGGLKSSGVLDIGDVSFATETATVEGLESRISLDGLLPPSTRHAQQLTIRRIDPALPLDDVTVQFRLEPAAPARLRVERARAMFAGGRLSVDDALLDPSRPEQHLNVGVDGIDLALLLDLLRVDDVAGSGRLTGTVPVTVADAGVSVADGYLAADGPGVLRVRSQAAAGILGGAGEQVTLMLSALEDFHYDALSATLDMAAGGDADIAVRMRGNNPAVLDGYPFAFNVGLGGNLVDLVAALRQGARFSSDMVRPQLR